MNEINRTKLKGVLFDLGGTLVYIDNDPYFKSDYISERVNKLLEPFDIHLTNEQLTEMAIAYWHKLKEEYFSRGDDFRITEFTSGLLKEIGFKGDSIRRIAEKYADLIFEFEYENTELYDGALKLLEFLKTSEYKIGLITNSCYDEARIRKLIRKVGIEDYFDVVLTSSDERCAKPNPEIFQKALDLLGLKPDEALYIGDRPEFDAQGAKNSGMHWITISDDVDLNTIFNMLS
ncbi:MAG: HAD family hydrolase [bacterium]